MNRAMTAKRLRTILLIAIVFTLAAIIGGFIFVQQNMHNYATQISKLNADANSGDQNIATLRGLEATMKDKQAAMQSARSLVADSSSYADTAINDISRIAAKSGVTISSFEFADVDAATTGTPAAAAPATTAPPATATAPTPPGVIQKTITVAVDSPLKYSSLMDFLRGIETNPLKLQIDTVTMAKDQGDKVSTQTFSIKVNVRQ